MNLELPAPQITAGSFALLADARTDFPRVLVVLRNEKLPLGRESVLAMRLWPIHRVTLRSARQAPTVAVIRPASLLGDALCSVTPVRYVRLGSEPPPFPVDPPFPVECGGFAVVVAVQSMVPEWQAGAEPSGAS
jgi:hypothetical protein